jgi:folate-binding protein YgfZ
MRGLAKGEGRRACLLTPRGKLRATLAVLRLGPDRLLLDAEPELAAALPGVFAEYALFHRTIALSDESATTAVLHVAGAEAQGLLSALLDSAAASNASLPSSPLSSAATLLGGTEVVLVAVDRGAGPGWDVRSAAASASEVESFLAGAFAAAFPDASPTASGAGAEALEPFRIASGIPRWGIELDETVLPDEAGLNATHVSYSKGCYIGQETVARLKTYGHVNRHLVRLTLSPGGAPGPGDALLLPGADVPREAVGRVTSAAGSSGLGWVKRGHEDAGTLLVGAVVEGLVGGWGRAPLRPLRLP